MASVHADLERAARFFHAHLDSDAQVQVLRLLAMARDHSWTAADVSRDLGVPVAEAAAALDQLCAHNLLDVRIGGELHFRYCPGAEELRDDAETFLRVLEQKPLELAKLIAERRRERERTAALRAFVDAFLLRDQGKKNG